MQSLFMNGISLFETHQFCINNVTAADKFEKIAMKVFDHPLASGS